MTPDEEAALAELVFHMSGPHTVSAIAKQLGISHQLVSQIEKRALAKMRKLLRQRKITRADI